MVAQKVALSRADNFSSHLDEIENSRKHPYQSKAFKIIENVQSKICAPTHRENSCHPEGEGRKISF
jgi:hypothetical protein